MKPSIKALRTEAELREVYGDASAAIRDKALPRMDEHVQAFIALSPFFCIGTGRTDAMGDVSARGGEPGFVHVLDDTTLAFPDRPGNNRLDTLTNLIHAPAVGQFRLADPLRLIVGGRFGWYTQNTTGWYYGTPKWKRSLDESAEFVPYAGLTYDLDRNHSVYASYTEIFQPQSSIDVQGNTLDPLTGTNYELGLKGEYFGGALNASAAVFRIKQRNRAVRDEANCPSNGAISCSRAAGEVQSDGVDLQIAGTLAPGWQLSAGYTYVSAKYTQDSVARNIGQRIATDEPQHLFKLYTTYRLPGRLSQWSVNGSVQAQSRIYRSETGYYTAQGTHAIVGIGAAYRVNERLLMQLSVDNLFDRHDYTNLGYSWSGGGERYGTPRSVLLTARYSL